MLPEDIGVIAVWDDASEAGNASNLGLEAALACVTDPRLPALGMRISGSVADVSAMLDGSPADVAAYDLHRISKGVPEGLKDYDYSDIFPHDADLDQLGGVSFPRDVTSARKWFRACSTGAAPASGSFRSKAARCSPKRAPISWPAANPSGRSGPVPVPATALWALPAPS